MKKLLGPLGVSLLLHFALFFSFLFLGEWKQNDVGPVVDLTLLEFPPQVKKGDPTKPKSKRTPPTKKVEASAAGKLSENKEQEAASAQQGEAGEGFGSPEGLPTATDEFLVSRMPVLVSEARISYPAQAKAAGVEGAVVMDLLIDAQGKVRQVTLLKGPGRGLNEAAMEAIKRFEFKPALVQDKPVAVKIRYTYRFILEN